MMISGKEGTLTERDNAILLDLYFTRILSTKQIALLYFKTEATAKKRLYELRRLKGVVEPMTPETGLTVWTLTKPAFLREAEFVYPEDRYRGFPEVRFIRHMLDANDLYVGLRKDLDRLFGEHPVWQWTDEGRLLSQQGHRVAAARTKRKKTQPDAELTFADNRYFIERETKRSKATGQELEEKVKNYRRYLDRQQDSAKELEVVFACDVRRDMDHVLEAAEKHDVNLTAGTVEDVTGYLLQQAKETSSAQASR